MYWHEKIIKHKYEEEHRFYIGPRTYKTGVNSVEYDAPKTKRLDNGADASAESLARTKRAIKDYARNNDFDYFITLTFDTKKVNSRNMEDVYKAVDTFLHKLRRRARTNGEELKYILVPEYHKNSKDGATDRIHLHGYIKGSLALKKSKCKDYNKKIVYNVVDWSYGFSTAIEITPSVDDTLRCASYITKYVTKDMITKFNKKRYWCSRNLSVGLVVADRVYYNGDITTMTSLIESRSVDIKQVWTNEEKSFITYIKRLE